MARSGDEGCERGVRTVEALRRSAHAMLSSEHSAQSRGSRRRGMLRARGLRPDSGSTFLIVEPTGEKEFPVRCTGLLEGT